MNESIIWNDYIILEAENISILVGSLEFFQLPIPTLFFLVILKEILNSLKRQSSLLVVYWAKREFKIHVENKSYNIITGPSFYNSQPLLLRDICINVLFKGVKIWDPKIGEVTTEKKIFN